MDSKKETKTKKTLVNLLAGVVLTTVAFATTGCVESSRRSYGSHGIHSSRVGSYQHGRSYGRSHRSRGRGYNNRSGIRIRINIR